MDILGGGVAVHYPSEYRDEFGFANGAVKHIDPVRAQYVADCFLAARTNISPLVRAAYRQLQDQTDRLYTIATEHTRPTFQRPNRLSRPTVDCRGWFS